MEALIPALIAVLWEAAAFAAKLGWPRLEWKAWQQVEAEWRWI